MFPAGGGSAGREGGEGDAPEDPERDGRAHESSQRPARGHPLPPLPQTEDSGGQEDAGRGEEGAHHTNRRLHKHSCIAAPVSPKKERL